MRRHLKLLPIILLSVIGSCDSGNVNQKAKKLDMEISSSKKEFDDIKKSNDKSSSDDREDFFDMEVVEELLVFTDDQIRSKYPGNNRPQRVYGNEDASITVGISLNIEKVSAEELPLYAADMEKGLKRSPGIRDVRNEFEEINGNKFSVIRFWSSSNDGDIYNMLCATSINNKLVMVTFNCLEDYYEDWNFDFEEMKKTIRFTSDSEV